MQPIEISEKNDNVKLNICPYDKKLHALIIILTEDIFFMGLVGTNLDFHKQKDNFLVGSEYGKIHKVSHTPSQANHTINQLNFFFQSIYFTLTNTL